DACFSNPAMSHGLFFLPAGPHEITIRVAASPYGSGAVAFFSFSGHGVPLPPSITFGGVVPIYSSIIVIQPSEWISIYGTNLSSGTELWKGDFPTELGGTTVTINGKQAFLWYVSPTQLNVQSPDDSTTGRVPVVVTTAGGTSQASVSLAQVAPSFNLLDNKHVAGIILRPDGSGSYGNGSYDIIGPTGNVLGYKTTPVRAGDFIELFGVGFGPTQPSVPAGKQFSGVAPCTLPVLVQINNVTVIPS